MEIKKDNVSSFDEGRRKIINTRIAKDLGLNPNANKEEIDRAIDTLDIVRTEKLDLEIYSYHFGLDRPATAKKLLEIIERRKIILDSMKARLEAILEKEGGGETPEEKTSA